MHRDDEIQDLVSTLNNINFQLAELARIKEALEPRLAALLQHGEDGSKSYIAGKYKITVTSGFNYTLNKEEYQINSARLPSCFNFVKQRVAFDIDKATLRDAEKYASAEELELIASMVSKKAKKLHIKLTSAH